VDRHGFGSSVPQSKQTASLSYIRHYCKLIAFSSLTLLVRWQEGHPACKKTEWWDSGMVICLGQGADVHMAQLMPLPLTISCSSKSRLVLPFWYRLSWVVPDKVHGAVQWLPVVQ